MNKFRVPTIEKRAYLDGDLVGVRNRITLVWIDDTVLAHRHGIVLDVFCYAFGGPGFKIEPH